MCRASSQGCTIEGAKLLPEMSKSLGTLPCDALSVPSQATVVASLCDVMPLSLLFHELECVFSIGLLPLDRAHTVLSSSSPGHEVPKNQYKMLKSEHTHCLDLCQDPLHLCHYCHHCHSVLPRGQSPDIRTHVQSHTIGLWTVWELFVCRNGMNTRYTLQ